MTAQEDAKLSNRQPILASPVGLADERSQERLITDLTTGTGTLPGSTATVVSGVGSELVNGEVVTYVDTIKTGTVDIAGLVKPFYNATGFGLYAGDVVTLGYATGITDPIAVGIFSNAGGYTPIITTNPQSNNNFPYDGDQLANQHNPPLVAGLTFTNTNSMTNPTYATHMGFAWYGSGALGYAGRIVVMPARSGGTTAEPGVAIYDVETGSVTIVPRLAPVAGAVLQGIGVMGTSLFLTWGYSTSPFGAINLVERWDSSTGVWSTYNIQTPVFMGVSDNRAWFLGISGGVTAWKIYSIDSAGTLSTITNPFGYSNAGTGSISASQTYNVFGRAKNGRLYIAFQLSGSSQMATALTNVAASSLTFTTGTSPNNFLWSSYGTDLGGSTTRPSSTRAMGSSDIDTDGDLVYAFRSTAPATWGFARVNRTNLAVTSYSQITSTTGLAADGELMLFGGLSSLGNNEVVMYGAVREDYAIPLGSANRCIPAHWRTDGTTTAAIYHGDYVIPAGSGFALARAVQRNTTSKTYVFIKNAANTDNTSVILTNATSGGPSWIDALTAP
jgi:hypothetical protein